MHGMKIEWALVVVLLSGCMTTTGSGEVRRTLLEFQPMDAPPKTGWKKVVTPEYELITDLDPQLTERAAQQLSQSLSGLKAEGARDRTPRALIPPNSEDHAASASAPSVSKGTA